MKTNSTQREILLVTNNSFAQRQWCNRDAGNDNSFTSQEQMEEICANGLICEILPEVFNALKIRNCTYGKCGPGFLFCSLSMASFPWLQKNQLQ